MNHHAKALIILDKAGSCDKLGLTLSCDTIGLTLCGCFRVTLCCFRAITWNDLKLAEDMRPDLWLAPKGPNPVALAYGGSAPRIASQHAR